MKMQEKSYMDRELRSKIISFLSEKTTTHVINIKIFENANIFLELRLRESARSTQITAVHTCVVVFPSRTLMMIAFFTTAPGLLSKKLVHCDLRNKQNIKEK